MATELDSLEIKLTANSELAVRQLDRLSAKLSSLQAGLDSLNTGKLNDLALGVQNLANSMVAMSGIGKTDFNKLASGISKIANVNAGQLDTVSASLNQVSGAIQVLSTVQQQAQSVVELAKAIGQLGSAKVERAVKNLPLLTSELSALLNTLSRAPTVSASTTNLINAIANLASQGSKVGTATRSINSGLNSFNRTATSSRKHALSLASAFGKFYATYFMVIRGSKKLWESVKNSMNYVEVLNYFDASFTQVADKADLSQWEKLGYDSAQAYYDSFENRAKELTAKMTGFKVNDQGLLQSTGAQSLGLNPTELMNYQSTFAQMASSMGVSADNATKLSQALTEIGADLASVKNIDFTEAWNKMSSGLVGMTRAVDQFGINLRNSNMQAKLTELGIDANISSLSQADKALLRTIMILDSSRYSWADLSDTLNQPANQLRLLESNFNNLSRIIGNLFLPAVYKALPYINGLVIALQRLGTWLANLLGLDISSITSGIGGMGDGLSDIKDEAEEAKNGIDGATGAAKKLKQQLQGFDQLNVITTKESSTGGAGALGTSLLDEAFNDALSEYQKVWDEAFARVTNTAEEIANKISKAFEPIRKIIQDFAIGDFFQAGKDTSKLVASIFNFFANAIKRVDWFSIGRKIGKFFAGINWIEILRSIGNLIWEAINASIKLWAGAFTTAPIETVLVSMIALPKLFKALTASTIISGAKRLGNTMSVLSNKVSMVFEAMTGNKAASSALVLEYPKLNKVLLDFQNKGLRGLGDNLTALQKAFVGIISVGVEFKVVKDSFYEITKGSDNLLLSIGKIAGVCAIASTALYATFGPAGLAVAGVTALIGAISGISKAFEEVRADQVGKIIKDALTNPDGTPIDVLINEFVDKFSSASKGFEELNAKSSSLSSVNSDIKAVWQEIDQIKVSMEDGVISVEEGTKKLQSLFENLATLTEQRFGAMNQVILSAFGEGGALREGYESLGNDSTKLLSQSLGLTEEITQKAVELSNKLSELDFGSDEYNKTYAELQKIVYGFDDFTKATSDFSGKLSNLSVDFSGLLTLDNELDVTQLQSYFDSVTSAVDKYNQDIDSAGDTLREYLQAMYDNATTEEAKKEFETALNALPTLISNMKTDARDEVVDFTKMLSDDYVSRLKVIAEEASAEYENLRPTEKLFQTKEDYVGAAISNFQEQFDKYSSTVETSLNKLGIDGSEWGKDSYDKIFTSLFNEAEIKSDFNLFSLGTIKTLKPGAEDIIDESFGELGIKSNGYGKNVTEGFKKGIEDNLDDAKTSAWTFGDTFLTLLASKFGIHSPAKETQEQAKYVVEGFNLGITDNQETTFGLISDFGTNILEKLNITDETKGLGQNAMQGFFDGISGMAQSISDKAKEIAKGVTDTIKTALDIHSPSKVMEKLGTFTMEGFQQGIEGMYESVSSSIGKFSANIQAPNVGVNYRPADNSSTFANSVARSRFDSGYDMQETNSLLRELVSAVREGATIEIDGRPVVNIIRNADRESYMRTGQGLFQH